MGLCWCLGGCVFTQGGLREVRHTPVCSRVRRSALASRTRTFGTGSDARLRRLGSKCSTNWSTGTHSSLTTACDKNTTTHIHCYPKEVI
jgi:hypothetical protein